MAHESVTFLGALIELVGINFFSLSISPSMKSI